MAYIEKRAPEMQSLNELDRFPDLGHVAFIELNGLSQLAGRIEEAQQEISMLNFEVDGKDTFWPTAIIDAYQMLQKNYDQAKIPVAYMEGYPTIDAIPIWERMEQEPLEYYNAFKIYRNMIATNKTRSLYETARLSSATTRVVTVIAAIYHWPLRVRAYDFYQQAILKAEHKKLVLDVMKNHRTTAEQLRIRAMKYLDENFDIMKPKEVLQALDIALKMERLSVDLDPMKPSTVGPTVKVDHRTINIGSDSTLGGSTGSATRGGAAGDDGNQGNLEQILSILEKSGAFTGPNQRKLVKTADESEDNYAGVADLKDTEK